MKKNGKAHVSPTKLSFLAQKLFERIPPEKLKEILASHKTFPNRENLFRVQVYLPREVLVLLEAYGAFLEGPSSFFLARAIEFMDRRAIEYGLVPFAAKPD